MGTYPCSKNGLLQCTYAIPRCCSFMQKPFKWVVPENTSGDAMDGCSSGSSTPQDWVCMAKDHGMRWFAAMPIKLSSQSTQITGVLIIADDKPEDKPG